MSAIDALGREGYGVTDAAVLVDRLEGGKAKLERTGVRLRSFTSIADLLQALQTMKLAKKDRSKLFSSKRRFTEMLRKASQVESRSLLRPLRGKTAEWFGEISRRHT
jgi:orotate phosphoribosyltransferase